MAIEKPLWLPLRRRSAEYLRRLTYENGGITVKFKATIEKMRQLMGVVAIALLAIVPFASSVASFATSSRSPRVPKVPGDSSARSAAQSGRLDYRTPSYEELAPAFEKVCSARMELLQCAAQRDDGEVKAAVLRYQEAIRVWTARFRKVQERSYAEEARDIWHEFCAMQRSDDNGRTVYAWEIEQFADESK
jgi:hypothetical protein